MDEQRDSLVDLSGSWAVGDHSDFGGCISIRFDRSVGAGDCVGCVNIHPLLLAPE